MKSQGHRVSFRPSDSSPDRSAVCEPCPTEHNAVNQIDLITPFAKVIYTSLEYVIAVHEVVCSIKERLQEWAFSTDLQKVSDTETAK